MQQRFTQREAARILGLEERRMRYWERLRLVKSRPRWGERFYRFDDLVALRAIQRLTSQGVPARRLRRAIAALQKKFAMPADVLTRLRIIGRGREVVVVPPPPDSKPIEPLTGQLLIDFGAAAREQKLRTLASRSAEEWFEMGLRYDASPETLEQAADAYRRAIQLAPDWVDAYINLGAVLFQLARLEEAALTFRAALELDPRNPTAHFNLGCVLFELEELDGAVASLSRAIQLAPGSADTHLNLALAYEKRNELRRARRHWRMYLRYEPNGAWAEYAQSRLARSRRLRRRGTVTEFPAQPTGTPPPATP